MPETGWGSLVTGSIVALPRIKNGFDIIKTWVDRLTRSVHLIPSCTTDTAVNVATAFFERIFSQHGLPGNIVSDRDPKFCSSFG